MYPRIYLSTESNFEHNGLGVLRDIVECYVEEEHNSFFELVMKYRVGGVLFDYLDEGNIIKADASDRLKGQLFRIHKTIKKSDSLIEVRANHISYDLMNDVVKGLDIKSQSCEYCLNEIFRQSDFCTHFVGYSDIEHSGDFSVEFTDCMSAIVGVSGSIVDTFGNGAEILRDNFDIHVLNRRGKDDNVLIAYKKNMLGIEIEEDKTDLVTRIYPFAKLTVDNVETVYKPSFEYIDSDNIKLYEHPYIKFMDFSDKFEEGQTPTDKDFRDMCIKYFRNNKCDIPKVNYKVQFIPLANTENYKDSYKVLERVGLMDSVLVKDTRFNIDTEAKVVRTKYDVIRGIYEEIELGSISRRLNDFIQGEQGRPGQDGADGVDGEQGPQGIPGLPGRDGVTYYTWIRYADNELGYNMSNHPLGKTHIGIAYNQLTREESDNPQDYKWSKFVGDQGIPGKDGSDGTPGLNGADGQTYYTYIKYALNDKGAGMSDSPVGMTHIGISYNNLSPVESTNPKDYAWSKFVGEDGKDGQDGIPGLNGSDGVTYYTWIRYADDEFGNGMSNIPENKDYIGIAYNKLERAESEDASLYAWSLIKGEQGVAGLNGLDGKTYYTWIKYSPNPNGVPMSDSSENMKYMGIAYNKETKEESNNPQDYRWSLIKGQDGTTFYTWIKFADNILGDGLSDDSTGKDYIGIAYNMESQQESTDPSLYTWTKIRGDVGLPGEPGNDGKTLYTWIKFANNANGDGISDNPEGKTYIGFAYNREEAEESNNPKDYVWSKYVGEKGEMGPQGIPGLDGANGVDGVTLYTWIRYADNDKGANMSNLPTGKDYIGIAHNKTSRVESTNPDDYVWSKLRGEQGIQGIQGIPGLQGAPGIDGKDGQDGKDGVDGKPGQDGKDGQDATERYMWVKYADDNKGTNMSDSPLNKDYIGLAYNKTTPTESNNASDYAWSLVKGATGSQGLPGINGENGKTFYVWIKYSANANGVPMSDYPENMKYIGIAYNKESKQESNNASDYTWSLIKGDDGTTFYTWIKYSNSPNGDNMSDDSTNKEYIGIAYNKTTATESNNPSDYTWTKLRGDQGVPGPSGANGKTLYTWVKYADNVDGLNMSDNPEGKAYLGLAFNKEVQQESTNPKDYTWSKIRGEDGQNGQDGKPGQDGEDGKDGDIESFPDTLPSTPVLKTQSFFSSISLSWTFENKLYYNYELYASQTRGFTPSSANLLCSGQLSAFMHSVSTSQTWYYRVRCVNSHGRATAYSAEVSGSTFKLNSDNIGNYMEEATIKDALIGELRLDRGWVGRLVGTHIDARNLTVTDGNGKQTLEIDSFGNVSLDVTQLKISTSTGSSAVATEQSVINSIKASETAMSNKIESGINDLNTSVNNSLALLENALNDKVVTESEKASLAEHLTILEREFADVEAQVTALSASSEIVGTSHATKLNTAFNNFKIVYNNLVVDITNSIASGVINDANIQSSLANYQNRLKKLRTEMHNCNTTIAQIKANTVENNINMHINTQLDILNKEMDDLDDSIHMLETTIPFIEDKVLSEAECIAIREAFQTVLREEQDITSEYNKLVANAYLPIGTKPLLQASYTEYRNVFLELDRIVDEILAISKDEQIDDSLISSYQRAIDSLKTAVASYRIRATEAIDAIAKEMSDIAKGDAINYANTQISVTNNRINLQAQEITTLGNRVTSNTTQINQQAKSIQLIAEQSQSTANGLVKAESKITLLSDSITNSVKKGEFSSLLQQNAQSIILSFNNFSGQNYYFTQESFDIKRNGLVTASIANGNFNVYQEGGLIKIGSIGLAKIKSDSGLTQSMFCNTVSSGGQWIINRDYGEGVFEPMIVVSGTGLSNVQGKTINRGFNSYYPSYFYGDTFFFGATNISSLNANSITETVHNNVLRANMQIGFTKALTPNMEAIGTTTVDGELEVTLPEAMVGATLDYIVLLTNIGNSNVRVKAKNSTSFILEGNGDVDYVIKASLPKRKS